jgi:hypothetical protein
MSNDHGLGYMMSYVKIISKALQGRASYSETVTQCHSVASAEESLFPPFDFMRFFTLFRMTDIRVLLT